MHVEEQRSCRRRRYTSLHSSNRSAIHSHLPKDALDKIEARLTVESVHEERGLDTIVIKGVDEIYGENFP